jgi:Ni,Fe-hydrogenase III small subunit
MRYLSARFKEPATWAGIAAIIPVAMQMAGGVASPDMIGAVAAGLAAIFMKEKGSPV